VTVIVLAIILAVAILLFSRLPLGVLALAVGGSGLLLAGYQWLLGSTTIDQLNQNQPQRAIASLVISALILTSSLMPLGVRRARKGPPKRPGKVTRTPTLAGFRGSQKGKPATKNGKVKPGSEDNGVLARYEVQDRVGIGGMATVFRAIRRDDNKTVALKIPQEKFVADAKFVRRFHREAEVLMRLNHPNIIKVFEHANEGTTHYIAMELIEGESLEQLIEGRRLTIQHSVEALKLTADALRYIHKQGIIHRDIKPGNIMIVRGAVTMHPEPRVASDGVKLMDFGIAAGKVLTRLTMTGARVGTPVYMSPEQARGLKIDHRSDIYSLGLVFYEMVTGTTAFKGVYDAVVQQQIFQTPPPPRQINLEVGQILNDLIMRMIEKDPDKRPTLTEVIEAIDGGLFEETTSLDAPAQIVVSLNSRKGPVRILDMRGNLERSLGQIGQGPDKLPAAPVAIATDKDLNMYAAIFEYRSGEAVPNMIRKLRSDGTEIMSFGSYGMKPGELLYPAAITVSPFGQVYILDSETFMIQRFSNNGEYLGKFGGRGKGRGSFDDPRAIIAGHDHFVYVLDYGNRQIQRFTTDGEFLNKYSFRLRQDSEELRVLDGVGVDSNGTLYVSDGSSTKIRTIKPDGKQGQTFVIDPLHGEDMTAILDIGIDHQSFVYAARRGGHLIRKYAPDGTFVASLETYAPILAFDIFLREPNMAAEVSKGM
jgi:eukaryotic-like serine/threonine-protein kinase